MKRHSIPLEIRDFNFLYGQRFVRFKPYLKQIPAACTETRLIAVEISREPLSMYTHLGDELERTQAAGITRKHR